jgi:hypothetical protein
VVTKHPKMQGSVFWFCVVRYLIIICFSLLFSNYSTYIFYIHCMFVFCLVFLFFILHFLCFCNIFVLFCALFHLLCCPFPIFVQVYQPLPLGGNPVAVNKYHITSQDLPVSDLIKIVLPILNLFHTHTQAMQF